MSVIAMLRQHPRLNPLRRREARAESRAMLPYNGSRVHKPKYELVGLASATGLFVWFLFWFKNDPGASLGTWR